MQYNESERVARSEYDNTDAATFYSQIWGGEDLHLGIYEPSDTPVAEAGRRALQQMASKIQQESVDYIVDLGSGYGGAARFLNQELGAEVLAVNLSDEQNRQCKAHNEAAGVAEHITVVDASYNNVPAPDGVADLVWSEDAFLHADRRDLPIAEAVRVLKDGGEFILSDPMVADGVSASEISGVLQRLNLSSLASPSEYKRLGAEAGLELVEFEDLSPHLTRHYRRILEEAKANADQLLENVSEEFLEGTMQGIQDWIDAGSRDLMAWGIFHFRKPA